MGDNNSFKLGPGYAHRQAFDVYRKSWGDRKPTSDELVTAMGDIAIDFLDQRMRLDSVVHFDGIQEYTSGSIEKIHPDGVYRLEGDIRESYVYHWHGMTMVLDCDEDDEGRGEESSPIQIHLFGEEGSAMQGLVGILKLGLGDAFELKHTDFFRLR